VLQQLTTFTDGTAYAALGARATGLALGSGRSNLLNIKKYWDQGDYFNSFRCLGLTISIVLDVKI
jgi:hypothetical protein